MPDALVLAIDQGTTGTVCIVFDEELHRAGAAMRRWRSTFPARPGSSTTRRRSGLGADRRRGGPCRGGRGPRRSRRDRDHEPARDHGALGTLDGSSGAPRDRLAGPADCLALRGAPRELIRERTGLVPDPYFSATKLEWLLDETDGEPADLAFGTVDSWLLWQLTGGAFTPPTSRTPRARCSSASRSLEWDDELLELFGVARARSCREVVARAGPSPRREFRRPGPGHGNSRRPAGSALRPGVRPRQVKATYGTGSFVLANAGERRGPAPEGLLRTAAWRLQRRAGRLRPRGRRSSSTGAAIQWLRDALGLLDDAAESEALGAVGRGKRRRLLRPGTDGLGSPHWAPEARGLIPGLTRGTTRAHLVRAALEAAAYQTTDVLDAMATGVELLRADGGMTRERVPDAVPGRPRPDPSRGRPPSGRRPRSAQPRSPASAPVSGRRLPKSPPSAGSSSGTSRSYRKTKPSAYSPAGERLSPALL